MLLKESSTITSKGQVTIPRALRDELGLHAGDRLVWTLSESGTIEVRKEIGRPLREIVGLLGKPARSATIEEMDRAISRRARATFGEPPREKRRAPGR